MSQMPQDPQAHAHHPHPHPPHGTDLETANKHHFDTEAQQYDDRDDAQRCAKKIGQVMRDTGLFKQATTVMDFACGTGLISRALAAEGPKLIVGVDISQGMVDQYNKTVSDRGIAPETMRAICTSSHKERLEGLGGMTFDVIVCASAYHHLPSISKTTETLATYLNPGGTLLVADLHGESAHRFFPDDVHHIVAHRGFTEQDIRSTFEKAGLKNITVDTFEIVVQDGNTVDFFLARGHK